MSKKGWIFPGQGSQALGMGVDLQEKGSEKFKQAEEILGYSILEKVQSSEDELSLTQYTQPCLYVIESILVDLCKARGLTCDYVAGHSLGEYVALYAAGVFNFANGLELVKQRALIMSQAQGGKMAALMKFDRAHLDAVLEKTPDVVLANDNSAEQVVISGTAEAIATVLEQVKTKRSMALKVSGAFHSPFMSEAAGKFAQVLDSVSFQRAQIPVLSNVDPVPTQDEQLLKEKLKRQMTGSVRWLETMLRLPELGITEVTEIGPGKVLTGLVKRTTPELELRNISSLADIG
jgi:[acyl-carrier-protein] S-malonyltransferase